MRDNMDKNKKVFAIGGLALAGLGAFLLLRKKGVTPPPPPPPPPPGYANLYGVVTDKQTGKPIQGASITLDGGQRIYTGAAGDYLFLEVATGIHFISVSENDYEPQGMDVTLIEGNNELNIQLVPIVIPPPPPQTVPLELIFNDVFGQQRIDILGINGHGFAEVGTDPDGIPYARLAEPVVVSKLEGVSLQWLDLTLAHYEGSGRLWGNVSLDFYAWYRPSYDQNPPALYGGALLPMASALPAEMTTGIGVRPHIPGNFWWIAGDYDIHFDTIVLNWFDSESYQFIVQPPFRIKNAIRCTNSGSI